MSRILLTGATGYIGAQFAKCLLPHHEVFALARTPFQTRYLSDCQDKLKWYVYDGSYASVSHAIGSCRPDLVYHLAAYYTSARGEHVVPELLQSNVVFGGYLLEAMAQYGCGKLIYTSTITEFGRDGSYRPLTLYAATKRAFSDLAEYYVDRGLLRMVTLVLADTYGPKDARPKILNLLKDAVSAHRKLEFTSDGEQVYDAVYIDDVLEALHLSGERLLQCVGEAIQCYQVFAPEPLSLKETVAKFEQVNQVTCDASWGKKGTGENGEKGPVRIYPPVPGWQAKISLDQGLQYIWRTEKG